MKDSTPKNLIRIGGASGYWGDSARSTPQLLADSNLDFIVYDYLAEITMSIMARARAKNDQLGYATDFISLALKPNLAQIADQGVKILSNAGGVNPEACATAVRALVNELGLNLKVACVAGDDLLAQVDQLAASGVAEMFSGQQLPATEKVLSVNAYLGAFPIAKALDMGADIVITGRTVDSAVTLGACIHSFGWERGDVDLLSAGSLCGHILECGTQATGGNFTDWELLEGKYESSGYPIAEIGADGVFVCTKPEGTTGVVNVGTVSEQMLYEIGDPQAYILPDVVCDFSVVTVVQQGKDRVEVSGAKGYTAPDTYKVSATYADEFRGGTLVTFYGFDADKKAQAFSEACLRGAQNTFKTFGLSDFSETSVEILGAESQFGSFSRIESPREVVVKIAVKHPDSMGVGIFLKELSGMGLAGPPGLSGFSGARPKPSPVVRLFSFLQLKSDVQITLDCDGDVIACDEACGAGFNPAVLVRPVSPQSVADDEKTVPLIRLAWGRSGDKGDKANVGIIARDAEYLPYIWSALTKQVVVDRFAHFLAVADESHVDRFLMPGSNAINFLLHDVLGGGGVASIRSDAQGKGYAQILLDTPIAVSESIYQAIVQ
ncbi:MAG: acyclic terpene utilization AtuA family protein [Pseudomonadales bacterium]